MQSLDFLKAVWPEQGFYCIATTPRGAPKNTPPRHYVFDAIEDAASFAMHHRDDYDVYFAVHTLKEARVWDEEKDRWFVSRRRPNMRSCRTFFFDLDVGEGKSYASQREAVAATLKFCSETGLPRPLMLSSGNGVHIYWVLADEIPSEEWRDGAARLKALAEEKGLHPDPSRTVDSASILRVAGTYNHKTTPLAVEVRGSFPVPTPNGAFLALLPPLPAYKSTRLGTVDDEFGSNTEHVFEGPPVTIKQLLNACEQVRIVALAKGNVSRQPWFHMVNTVRCVEDGRTWAQRLSSGHPEYDADLTDKYIDEAEAKGCGPTTCNVWERDGAPDVCKRCFFYGTDVKAPTVAARRASAPPAITPQAEPELTAEEAKELEFEQLDLPRGFSRVDGGGVNYKKSSGDEDEPDKILRILGSDLYPLYRKVDADAETDQHQWCVHNPNEALKSFTLDSGLIHVQQDLMRTLSANGVYVTPGMEKYVRLYMSLYIQDLQRKAKAEQQVGQLGWIEDYSRFVLHDKIIGPDGDAPVFLRPGIKSELEQTMRAGKKGSMAEQIRLMQFYNEPDQVARQFMILASLASPIFYMTGHHGSIVHANGEPGSAKSTTLGFAMSMWGHPEKFMLNGLKDGGTANARNFHVTILNSLPMGLDEMSSDMGPDVAAEFALGVSQASPGKRRMMSQKDELRRANTADRSNLVLTTGNLSLHALLAGTNVAGNAGIMRIFEMSWEEVDKSPAAQGRAMMFWEALHQNYGHIGEAFIRIVIKRQKEIAERVRKVQLDLISTCELSGGERFWPSIGAAVIVTCEIAYEAGLLPFDANAIRSWLIHTQLPAMRGVTVDSKPTALQLLTDYLNTLTDNLVVMSDGNVTNIREPRGKLKGRYEPEGGHLWLDKTAFRDYCVAHQAPMAQYLHQLAIQKIVIDRHCRKVLTAGTSLPGARPWCAMINMRHPELMGALEEQAAKTGRPPLRLVKDGE